jgi:AraC family transcriptional activator of pobA
MPNLLYYFYIPNSKPGAQRMKKRSQNPPLPTVPRFALYGEQSHAAGAELVHIELIETRSRLHDWHIARHTHAGLFQVLFLTDGQLNAEIDNSEQVCTGPTVITIHPSVEHGFDFSHEAEGYVLTVDQSMVFGAGDGFAPLFVHALVFNLNDESQLASRLELLMTQLMTEFAGQHQGHALMLQWLAQCVMMLLVRLHAERLSAEQSGRNDFELFSRFRAQLEQHYKEQWVVEQYARKLSLTPARLNRLCLRLAQQSAFDLTQRRLMLEACRQLTYLPSAIATIAYELGFQDPAYFSRTFKRQMGTTPTLFRERKNVSSSTFRPHPVRATPAVIAGPEEV